MMPRRITDLVIDEVSTVDRGAGEGVQVLLMKRDKEETEMMMTIEKALAMPEKELVAVCKSDAVSKPQLYKLIDGMAQRQRQRGESREIAYTKFITEDVLGRELVAVLHAAAGPDH